MKYYEINEKAARVSHDMMSFSSYKEGSTTASYRAEVREAEELAQRAIKARPEKEDLINSLLDRYSRRMAEYYNRESTIGCMCPSVLISGSGNFPTRKKQKQVAVWDRNREYYADTQKILNRIRGIISGKDIIHSDDENAIELLTERIEALKENHERLKLINKLCRMKDTAAADIAFLEIGIDSEQAQKLRDAGGLAWYKLPYSKKEIHRLEDRLKAIQAEKEAGKRETENDFCTVIEDPDTMRIKLVFDGKPSDEIRTIIKKHGFRWAPSQKAWQRNLNSNGRFAVKCLLIDLERMNEANK